MKINYSKEDEMATIKLMERALSGKHSSFELLGSMAELRIAKSIYKAVKAVAKGFTKTGDRVFEAYLANIAGANHEMTFEDLITYKKIKQCEAFYIKDAEIIKDAIDEYVCYLHSGNLFKAVLGINRTEEELVDYRKIPVSWNPFKKDK